MKIKKKHVYFFIVLGVILLLVFAVDEIKKKEEKIVREPAVAGTWYPGDKVQLSSLVEGYFSKAEEIELAGVVKGIIVPHAGYVYSGQVAAEGFKQLKENYKKVFIISTNHAQGANIQGISVPDVTHYKTPLGEVKVSKIAKELMKYDLFLNVPEAHTTHVIEIELPFLQEKLGEFEIIPMVTGGLSYEQIVEAADIISQYLDDETLIVISSDLSHYHPYDEAVGLDTECIKNIEALNFQEAAKCEACSLYAIFILMELAKRNGWQAKIIDYKNSGDTAGDKSSVVGYSSIVFYGEIEKELNEGEKNFLLKLARKKLESIYTEEDVVVDSSELTPNLKKVQGCFTTLNENGNLRGCIGHILPHTELYKCVLENVENAALHDSRFKPVTQDELKDIEIEISVLSVPEKLDFSSPDGLLEKLRPLVDGVVLKYGLKQATYLPQVWEQLPDKEVFLTQLCIKSGSSADCWKDDNVEIFTYHANVFDES